MQLLGQRALSLLRDSRALVLPVTQISLFRSFPKIINTANPKDARTYIMAVAEPAEDAMTFPHKASALISVRLPTASMMTGSFGSRDSKKQLFGVFLEIQKPLKKKSSHSV